MFDPRKHPDWLEPHSLEWYQQLGDKRQIYSYPWKSTIEIPNGETVFDEELLKLIPHKKVLDVGCGHGEFAMHCSKFAEEVVGFDVTDSFLESGKGQEHRNLKFVLGNTKDGLPFSDDTFDIAYIRKGPTSAYEELKRVVKENGIVVGLHPADHSAKELVEYFPQVFEPSTKTPILDKLNRILMECSFTKTEIEVLETTEYLHSPLDVVKLRCFGQSPQIHSVFEKENLTAMEERFQKGADNKGLPITHARYIVRVTV